MLKVRRIRAMLLGESADRRSSSSIEILEHQAERLLDGLLFHREAPLKGPIQGSSSFASDFGRNATRDSADVPCGILTFLRASCVIPAAG